MKIILIAVILVLIQNISINAQLTTTTAPQWVKDLLRKKLVIK